MSIYMVFPTVLFALIMAVSFWFSKMLPNRRWLVRNGVYATLMVGVWLPLMIFIDV